ncbi:MAG: hypothetical protein AB7G28_22345 [Pirellulales bacterium]
MYDTLSTSSILDVFEEQVCELGGRVSDTFHDGGQLFVRSLLPNIQPVRPGDKMQAGLALRASDEELWLHPYMFRQLCRNGAIMAQAIESLHVECLGAYTREEGTDMLREAIVRCADPEVFARSLRRVRSSVTSEMDGFLAVMQHLAPLLRHGMGHVLHEILGEYAVGRERTRFGLMNAVTAVARETSDPDAHWRLEELGGDIGARLLPKRPTPAPARARHQAEPVPTS